MTVFILAAEDERTSARATFNTDHPHDERLEDLHDFVDACGKIQLSTAHQLDVICGPEHPRFNAAVAAYGFIALTPCDPNIVRGAIDLLVAGEILEPEYVDDSCLFAMISVGFASERDWTERRNTAEMVSRAYLQSHYQGFEDGPEGMDAEHLAAYSAFVGGLIVAVSHARAAWSA